MNNMANDEKKLYEMIVNSLNVQIYFKYREIFSNAKVKDIFGPYINDFITMLADRYKNGSVIFEKNNGIVLRNMIEAVVAYIADNNNFKNRLNFDNTEDQTVRKFLNNDLLGYSRQFENKFERIHKNYSYIRNRTNKTSFSEEEKDIIKKSISKYYKDDDKLENQADLIIEYSNAKVLIALNDFYFKNPYDCPPKYIFSYIDNIYTVTSEISAHGKNDKTTEGLCADGWSALLSGMIQIMQWVAETNPNKSSSAN